MRRHWTDWQQLVDDLALAAAIARQEEVVRWRVSLPYSAKVVANHYYSAVLAGNLNLDAIDGELFALEAALALHGYKVGD